MKPFETTVDLEIKRLLHQKNYPCIAALQSFPRSDYCLKTYENFGDCHQRFDLREDLLNYLSIHEKGGSPYFTFWAVFNDVGNLNEDEFELGMCREISALNLDGRELFVVGLHPASSRLSRRFPWPALVFNAFEQFETMKVKNQMVELYSDFWEGIQFPGKANGSDWRMPFQLREV